MWTTKQKQKHIFVRKTLLTLTLSFWLYYGNTAVTANSQKERHMFWESMNISEWPPKIKYLTRMQFESCPRETWHYVNLCRFGGKDTIANFLPHSTGILLELCNFRENWKEKKVSPNSYQAVAMNTVFECTKSRQQATLRWNSLKSSQLIA